MFPRERDPSHVPLERLEAEIEHLAAGIATTMARWLELVGEYDARDGWWSWGTRSCADWVAWRCGLSARAAREHVRVARALRELPQTRDLFNRGELTYSKVKALTRVADPDSEAKLIELARHATAAQLDRILAGYRRVTRSDAARAQGERHLWCGWDDDGSLRVTGRFPQEEGALVMRALEAARDALFDDQAAELPRSGESDGPAGPPHAEATDALEVADAPAVPRPSNAEALSLIVESFLASGPAGLGGGERYHVVLHSEVDGRLHLDDGPAVCGETAQRIACDASLVKINESRGSPLSVGRRTRSIPPSIRRALNARDQGCRFPGCSARRFVDAHHIVHWADGGETSSDNLVLLCRHHHGLVHEGGFQLEGAGDGLITIRRHDGRRLEPTPTLRPTEQFAAPPAGPILIGTGEKADLGMCVEAVLVAKGQDGPCTVHSKPWDP